MKLDAIDAQALIKSLQAGVVIHAPDSAIVYANPKALEILRLSEEQAIGRCAFDPEWHFLDENKRPLEPPDYPVQSVLSTRTCIYNREYGIKDGQSDEITWVLASAYSETDDAGEITQVIVTFFDISADRAEVPFEASLNSLSQQIAVIDADGLIQWVNEAWESFARENGAKLPLSWKNTNYLDVCSRSTERGDSDSIKAAHGIQSVVSGEVNEFYFEYECNSPSEVRWFMMRVRPLYWDGPPQFVIAHENITARKMAELKVQEMAITDGLTGLANRRYFDEFLETEWSRARRMGYPVSLILLDIDHFKPYNDAYGHLAGDECLRKISGILRSFSNRPDDLAARYGGEEFALVLGNTTLEMALIIARKICASIRALAVPHEHAPEPKIVTASLGVASVIPDSKGTNAIVDLIENADKKLYSAKIAGRNRVMG